MDIRDRGSTQHSGNARQKKQFATQVHHWRDLFLVVQRRFEVLRSIKDKRSLEMGFQLCGGGGASNMLASPSGQCSDQNVEALSQTLGTSRVVR